MKLTKKNINQIKYWNDKELRESIEKTAKKAKKYKGLAFLSFFWLPFGILAIQYAKGLKYLTNDDSDLSGGFIFLNMFLSLVPTLFLCLGAFLKGKLFGMVGKNAEDVEMEALSGMAGPKIVKPSSVK